MTDNESEGIRGDLQKLEVRLAGDLAEIKILIATEAQRCPYREAIAKSTENAIRITAIEVLAQQVRADSAKSGAVGGVVVATVTGLAVGIGKITGWW